MKYTGIFHTRVRNILPTRVGRKQSGVGTMLPALSKVQEAFNKSEPLFSHINCHFKK